VTDTGHAHGGPGMWATCVCAQSRSQTHALTPPLPMRAATPCLPLAAGADPDFSRRVFSCQTPPLAAVPLRRRRSTAHATMLETRCEPPAAAPKPARVILKGRIPRALILIAAIWLISFAPRRRRSAILVHMLHQSDSTVLARHRTMGQYLSSQASRRGW
jgi:hypothetical protein